MGFIKNFFTAVGAIVVIGFVFAFFAFDLGTRIGQVSKLDPKAIPEYMKMFDAVLTTGDPAKGMIRKAKLIIPEGMTKMEAIENAIEIMDSVGEEHGLAMVDTKLMSNGKKDAKGVYHPYVRIRSYCSPTIAKVFLSHSDEFIGFMPCRLGIVENSKGEIYIYTMSLELMINGGYTLPKKLLTLANEVRSGMYEMMYKSAKGDDD
jgi:uncharacterized protein (DUF302 family)